MVDHLSRLETSIIHDGKINELLDEFPPSTPHPIASSFPIMKNISSMHSFCLDGNVNDAMTVGYNKMQKTVTIKLVSVDINYN